MGKEHTSLNDIDVYHLEAGQVYFAEKAITEGLNGIPSASQLKLFKCINKMRLPSKEIDALESAYDDFATKKIVFVR